MITFDNVCYAYPDCDSLIKNLSFTVDKGEFVSIIGENGAGKTTVSKLIDGLIKPTSGTVTVAGLDTAQAKTSMIARHVGFLFQDPNRQICKNTVREEIAFGLTLQGMEKTEIDRRVERVLAQFGFDGDQDPFTLGRGERQRVALASIIAVEPEIMILDEPTTGLDYRECMQVMDAIAALNRQGVTVVMVCHDMEVVLDFARRVLVVSGGTLLKDGETRAVFRDEAVMRQASVLPPQIVQLAQRLGGAFADAAYADEMVAAVLAGRAAR